MRARHAGPDELLRHAGRALDAAKRAGAPLADACLESSRAFTVRVLGGRIENLQQGGALGLGLRVVVFYFALIRPQQKKTKEHAALLKAVRAGDKIVTNSGIVAVVVTVKEKTLTIRSADAKLEITKSAIAEILDRSGEPSES